MRQALLLACLLAGLGRDSPSSRPSYIARARLDALGLEGCRVSCVDEHSDGQRACTVRTQNDELATIVCVPGGCSAYNSNDLLVLQRGVRRAPR